MQKQINKIITFIKNRKLFDHDSYPIDIKQTVWDETEHIIKLKIDNYLKFRQLKAEKSLEKSRAKLNNDTKTHDKLSKQLSEIDAKIDEVMATLRKLKKERHPVSSAVKEAAEKTKLSQSFVEKGEDDLNLAKALKEYDESLNKSEKAKRIKKAKP